MKRTGILILVLMTASLAFGQNATGDGNSIIKSCHDAVQVFGNHDTTGLKMEDIADAMYCRGLVRGVLNTLAMSNWLGTVTKGATPDQDRFPDDLQAMRVVDKFLRDHPEKLADPDWSLIGQALTQAFPSDRPHR